MAVEDKRFIAKVIPIKAWRKLSPSLRQAWFYLWMTADPAGVCDIDEVIFKVNEGTNFPLKDLQKHMSEWLEFDDAREIILIKDFIRVNYGVLKEKYNPHKPIFRSIEKNSLKLRSSLNEACLRLEDEDVYEEEEEKEGGVGETKNGLAKLLQFAKKGSDPADQALNKIQDHWQESGHTWDLEVMAHCKAVTQKIFIWVKSEKGKDPSANEIMRRFLDITSSQSFWVKSHFSMKILDEKFDAIRKNIETEEQETREPNYYNSKYETKVT